jgi:hypothetical protein
LVAAAERPVLPYEHAVAHHIREESEMSEQTEPLTGHCMCGAVHVRIDGPLLGAAYCHCKRCQRRTGTAFSVSGLTEPGSLEVTSGSEHVATYHPPDDGWLKSYCTVCGSQLYTANPENEELIAVRMGILDADPGVRPSVHQFVAYAAPWLPLPDDGLPRFPERMQVEGPPPPRPSQSA